MVEILNENDNKPIFIEETVQPVAISEVRSRVLFQGYVGCGVVSGHQESSSEISHP